MRLAVERQLVAERIEKRRHKRDVLKLLVMQQRAVLIARKLVGGQHAVIPGRVHVALAAGQRPTAVQRAAVIAADVERAVGGGRLQDGEIQSRVGEERGEVHGVAAREGDARQRRPVEVDGAHPVGERCGRG